MKNIRYCETLTSSLSPLLAEHVLGIGRAWYGSSHLTVPEEIGGHEKAGGHLSQKANQPLSRLGPGATHDKSGPLQFIFPSPNANVITSVGGKGC